MRIVRFRIGDKTSYGVGPSYREHAAELGMPIPSEALIALKPISALIGPDDPIVHPIQSGRLECEAELAIVMRRRCRNVPRARVREYVLGYTFDTFCPIGPCIVTDLDPNTAVIETWINEERRQSASTRELIFPVEEMVPGDVIGSGTPASVGPLAPGDRVEVRIEGIGTLANTVVKV